MGSYVHTHIWCVILKYVHWYDSKYKQQTKVFEFSTAQGRYGYARDTHDVVI